MRVGMSTIAFAWWILGACAPAPRSAVPPPPSSPPPAAGASWTWTTDHVACRDIWKTGYACDGGAVAWRACGPARQPVTYIANGARHDVTDVCVRCAAPLDPPPAYHPLEAGCVAEPGNPHPEYNPFNGMLYIDGATWEPNADGSWTISPPRPAGAPVGADMIPYRCGKHVVPGSVKPETCGYDGGPHASPAMAPAPAPAPPPPPAPPPRAAFTCPPKPDHAASAPRATRKPTIVVDVYDYLTGKGIPGVTVMIHHQETCTRNDGCTPTHAHPPAVLRPRQKTDRRGRATFVVPDLDYGGFYLEGRSPASYLDWSSIYNLGAKQCHEISTPAPPFDAPHTKRWVASLVPTSMLEVTTPAQAIAIAQAIPEIQQWMASHPGITPTARGGGSAWQVMWAVGDRAKRQVHVNAFDGSAGVNGRWTD